MLLTDTEMKIGRKIQLREHLIKQIHLPIIKLFTIHLS